MKIIIVLLCILFCDCFSFSQIENAIGSWKGNWTNDEGYLYNFVLNLNIKNNDELKGEIKWELVTSPNISEKNKLHLTATEFVTGNYDDQTNIIYLKGTDKNDPNNIIGLDVYNLVLKDNNNSISGKTENHGNWKGTLNGTRIGEKNVIKPKDDNLVLYLPFIGNANDLSGNSNNGIVYDALLASDRNGNENSAYYFNGKSSYIEIPSSKSLKSISKSLSICAWVNVNKWYNNIWAPIMSKSNSSAFGMITIQLLNLQTNRKFENFVKEFEVIFNSTYLSASYLFELNKWYFIVLTWDGSKCMYYVNGVNIAEKEVTKNIDTDNNPLIIGKDAPSALEYLTGKLDDIRIYNRSLNVKEVQNLYTFNELEETVVDNSLRIFSDAKKAYDNGNYSLVIDLLKDFPESSSFYDDAIALMLKALEKLKTTGNLNFVSVYGQINNPRNINVSGYIIFEDLISGSQVGKCRIGKNGYYYIILPSGKRYSYYIDAAGFYPLSRIADFTSPAQDLILNDNITLVSLDEMTEQELSIRINNIFFDYNESTLKPESFLELDRLYNVLSSNSDINVEISGHTDNVGSDEYNIKLSQSRSEAVKEYLVKKGINTNRIISKGYGKSNPVATNDTEEGKQLNRRVEFKILKK
jgi:outer membrane protein OmpA-like peptidoglycan-associated protein